MAVPKPSGVLQPIIIIVNSTGESNCARTGAFDYATLSGSIQDFAEGPVQVPERRR